MFKIDDELTGYKSVAIAGHIRPDGDCVGSCLALYNYLSGCREELGLERIDVFLEPFNNVFNMLAGSDKIRHDYNTEASYDVLVALDCGSIDRLGEAQRIFAEAKKTINIDHHISNTNFARVNHVVADASSTCEVLYSLLDQDRLTKEIAEALYIGIIHDTGVFKHSNTSGKTMAIAGRLMDMGINFSALIDDTFYAKTYLQNQILGRCLMESMLVLHGKVVFAALNRKILDFYGATPADLDGIIDQLRVTKDTEVAVFIYEIKPHEFKVSMRSNGDVNVSRIAVYFGGGGHIRAAGCTMLGTVHDVINNLTPHIEAQLKELGLI